LNERRGLSFGGGRGQDLLFTKGLGYNTFCKVWTFFGPDGDDGEPARKRVKRDGQPRKTTMTWIQQVFGESVQLRHVLSIFFGCYILGCFATGYYLVRWKLGQDIRESGSGNVGAKNAGRLLGTRGFVITLLGDFAKGTIAVWATKHFFDDYRLMGFAMLAVVMGHVWPVQLGFHGGKGVATSLGAMVVYDFHLALAFTALTIGLFLLSRRITLSGLLAFALLPLAVTFMEPRALRAVVVSLLAGMILLSHRRNLLEEFTGYSERRAARSKNNPSTK
jgi:glycerol-3-phosphate acyltransferase PlsY